MTRAGRASIPRAAHATAVLLAAFCATAMPPGHAGAESQDATGLFAGGPTLEGVIALAGTQPSRCVTTVPPARICAWPIAPSTAAHEVLRPPVLPNDWISLVCDVGSAPVRRCTVHTPSFARAPRGRAATIAEGSRRPGESLRELEAARDLGSLVHALGSVPDDCVQRDESEWVCVWRVEPGVPAHRIVAESAGTTGSARLVCRLPLEGGTRDVDSCRALPED